MTTNSRAWVHGLVAALASTLGDSGTAALGAAVVAPGFLRDGHFWEALAGMLLFSALKTVFAYLKQSPLPASDEGSPVDNSAAKRAVQ
jgi:hypothetical protein